MFYSQFILAKKGPLGTIWIAAHLERKLRKNQVADTDIGVSVDSILFPEAPIALRLSSHLLLGVVRIYSRKVNYLFHDCSEALLKIKQAFRSTAVDLPPEESTAPYHSITLPETFHLDDFELPDSAFLHGNSVDHHVSTREQITLQDNTDGMGYLTSQFGQDERFGDGDTSQFGLDLDEDVFLDKVTTSQHGSVSFDTEYAVNHDQPFATFNDMEIGQGQHNMDAKMNLDIGDIEINENPSADHGYSIQTPDLNEVLFRKDQIEGQSPTSGHIYSTFPVDDIPSPQLIECAQIPPTPVLLEGLLSAHAQEIPPLIPHEKNSPSSFVDAIKPETEGILHPECDCPGATNKNLDALAISPESTDLATSIPTSTALESISPLPQLAIAAEDDHNFGGEHIVDGLQNKLMPTKADGLSVPNEIDDNREVALSDDCSPGAKNLMNHLDAPLPNPNTLNDANDRDPVSAIVQPCSSKFGESNIVSVEARTSSEDILSLSCKDMDHTSERPAREGVVHPTGSSVDVPGEDSCLADVLEPMVRMHQTSDSVLSENTTGAKKQKELTSLVSAQDNQLNCTSSSEFPETEKMLSAPNGNTDLPNDLGQLTSEKGVTESDESVDRNKSLSGKKHHLTDSMSALQSGSSAKSAGRPRLRRTREHIPDDDDLLASILVGRTPNFKSQPASLHKVNSVKRPRLNPKVSLLKRKVLLDDTMVLHADAIRQQLINTEDIRRIRKKAPCTRSEIWMVQSSSEELEIFEEPIVTGISAELHSLHARTYTSSGNPAFPSSSKFVGETFSENVGEQVVVLVDNVDGEIQVPSNLSVLTEPSSCKDAGDCDAQEPVVSQLDLPQQEQLDNNTHNSTQEIDGRVAADVHVVSSNFEGGVKVLTDSCIEVSCIHENHKSDASYVKSDDACMPTREQSVHESNELKDMNDEATVLSKNVRSDNFTSVKDADGANGADQLDNGATPHPINGHSHAKDGTCLQADMCVLPGDENLSVPDVMMEFVEPNSATINGQQEVERDKEDCLEVGLADKVFQEQLFLNEEHPSAVGVHEEMTEKVSSSPLRTVDESENLPSTVGENSGFQVLSTEGVMDDESTPMDFSTLIESSDFCSAINGNTEFLNADDEEDYCEADNDLQNPEEAQSLENSGWSSRTRGVARYLKSLFDDEYGHGRKAVAMDHLIAGKTRKEASRMFFETLVLKTKDYIQVEQANPCDIINIKPQTKLLKSEF